MPRSVILWSSSDRKTPRLLSLAAICGRLMTASRPNSSTNLAPGMCCCARESNAARSAGKKTWRQGDVKPTSYDFFFGIRSVTMIQWSSWKVRMCHIVLDSDIKPLQFTVQAVWQSNTHTSRSPHFPARCLHSWMTRCPATKRLTKMKWHDTTGNKLSSSSSLDYLFCSLWLKIKCMLFVVCKENNFRNISNQS